jgi:protein SCO1/2
LISCTALYFYNFDKNYRNLLGKQLKASYILHNPDKPLPKFSLLDHNRQLFDNERLKKGWSLLLFIYTHCPDVCPTELLDMSQLKNLMAKDKTAHMPTVSSEPLGNFSPAFKVTGLPFLSYITRS